MPARVRAIPLLDPHLNFESRIPLTLVSVTWLSPNMETIKKSENSTLQPTHTLDAIHTTIPSLPTFGRLNFSLDD
jgi:hypothetical protein